MSEREKVIQHFSDCCYYAEAKHSGWVFARTDVLADALALLKAQEPEKCKNTHEERIFCCSVCGYKVADIFIDERRFEYPSINFCPNCGRKVHE